MYKSEKNRNFSEQWGKDKMTKQKHFQKITRYADISVADFLDKVDESQIDNSLVKKIGEMKRLTHRPRSKT